MSYRWAPLGVRGRHDCIGADRSGLPARSQEQLRADLEARKALVVAEAAGEQAVRQQTELVLPAEEVRVFDLTSVEVGANA
ncbi:MAG TPA: hypothetical protein VFH39_01820 [Candidatus Saccharimonadales bacterium]|nr:hypothetical protein [Candidatus Saccharimonadales bacterium]